MSKQSKPDDICSICHSELDVNDIKLACKHFFHKNCIKPWLEISEECPMCRAGVTLCDMKKAGVSPYDLIKFITPEE